MQAHDPGLSSLELAVTSSRIVAIVSVAAPDAAIILASHGKTAPTPESGADTERLGSFALGAISIRVDGRALQGRVQRVDIDDTGGRVQIGYRATPGSRIAVSSAIPRWLTAGHRELLSIRNAEGSVLVQQMLDAQSGDSVTELRRASSSSRGLVSFLLAGVLLLLAGGGRMARRLAAAEWPSGGGPWSIRSSARRMR
jgi:hypothetical protein